MDNIKWVSKALSKRSAERPVLKQLAYIDGKVIACDGFRLHAWTGEADITTPDKYPDAIGTIERAKNGQTTIEISKYHLVKACKAVHALLRGESGYKKWGSIHLEIDDHMHCEAERKDKGTVRVNIKNGDNWPSKSSKKRPMGKPHIVHYKHIGPPLKIALNPTFIIDALRGMQDIVTLTLQGCYDPVYIKSEHTAKPWEDPDETDIKEAIIMPMNIGR